MQRFDRVLERLRPIRFLIAIGSPVLLGLLLRLFTTEPPVVLFTLPIIATAYIGRLKAGLVATGTTTLSAAYFLLDPTLDSDDVVALISLGAVGITMTLVIEALHRSRNHAQQSQENTRRSQALFAQAFANSPSPMSVSRLDDGIVVDVNDAYLDAFGLERQQIIDHTPTTAGITDENADRAIAFAKLRTSGSVTITGAKMRTSAGVTKTVDVSSQRIDRADGSYVLSTFLDLTDQKQAEDRATESEAQFRELAESIREVFWLSNPDSTKMFYISPAYEEIFGRKREAIYANPADWILAVHPDDRERMTSYAASVPTSPRSSGEYRIIHTDGTIRTIRVNIFPVRDATGRVVKIAGVAEDISDRIALEDQVRQSQKLESLGLLAGGIAHDFNNILAVICTNSCLLGDNCKDPGDRELVDEIDLAVQRASGMTRQLLAFSRKQVTEPVVIDLNAAVNDTRKMLRRMVGEDIEIIASLEPELGRVKIDPGHFVQVLMNLAVNARDAMARGGKLMLTTRNVDGKHGPEVLLSVGDTGCGMPADVRDHAFEPFFTTKGIGKGTGLGLSVVHGIIEQAGGRVELRSEVGIGTTFEIYLPATQESLVEVENVALTGAHGVEKILFVDDDLYVRTTAARALRSRGYVVLEAANGNAALELINDHANAIDLLVTDVVMPGMDGRSLVEAATKERPELHVLYMSGYADDAVVRHGVYQADVAFIEKPFRIHALASKVRHILDAA